MARKTERIALAGSSPGTRREVIVHRYGAGTTGRKAYLQASLHADEIPALLVLHHLVQMLDDAAESGAICGEIVLVPYANPIGLDQFVSNSHSGRYELAGGGNFNRNWPDLTAGLTEEVKDQLTADTTQNVRVIRDALRRKIEELPVVTELQSLRRLLAGLAFDADLLFDVHCDSEALMHLYTANGLWPEAADIAAELGCRAVLLAEDSGGNAFDECFSVPWSYLKGQFPELPIPLACHSSTVELRGKADVSDVLAQKDANALFRSLQRRGYIEGDPGPAPAALCEATELAACAVVKSPASGILSYHAALGDHLRKGDVIAWLIDPASETPKTARQAILAPTDGLVLARATRRYIMPGSSIAKVVGHEILEGRVPGQLLPD